ncbi:MAG: DNA-processing protein DprA [Lachnospiraceae bacterium]|nr:DNA-processing protein DprA [Lachnospiraceae bacterium]
MSGRTTEQGKREDRERCWHWFHGLQGISQKEKEELLLQCPDVAVWYEESRKSRVKDCWKEGMVPASRTEHLQSVLQSDAQRETLLKSYEKLKKEGIRIVTREDEDYPEGLRTVFQPPFLLYYYGRLPEEQAPSLAVIGARNCSVYGEEIASGFSLRLSAAGIQIVSGMARGIDAAAQRAAINAVGSAYAVLGSGVDVCYPRENKKLYEALKERGGVISEEVPGTPPVSWNFPKRNRIISGLSDAVFVVEARENSGSLITVSYALEQGKEIYAVPGRIYERLAEGTNRLLQEGAYLVREPEDILRGFGEKYGLFLSEQEDKKKIFKRNWNLLLASREKIVYACLSLRPKHIEELQEETGMDIPELTSLLFDMEQKHYIKQPLKNYFIIQENEYQQN